MDTPTEVKKGEISHIDPRIYLGILVFRWKLIIICLLYFLIGGVFYLEFMPRQYLTSAAITIYRDPNTQIQGQQYLWTETQTHVDLLRSPGFNDRVVSRLSSAWAEKLGNPNALRSNVDVRRVAGSGINIQLSIKNNHPSYARAYLDEMIEIFRSERESLKQYASKAASKVLEEQLARLEEKIRAAEDDVVEFQRLNQMEFVQAKGQLELGYLQELLARQQQLSTEQWMLELQFPRLKGASAGMIRQAKNLTADTGRIRAPRVKNRTEKSPDPMVPGETFTEEPAGISAVSVPDRLTSESATESAEDAARDRGWQETRMKLASLDKEKNNLIGKLQPDHPQIRAINEEISRLQKQLDFFADLEFKEAQDRYEALDVQVTALEEAQRRWKNSYLMASRKGADLRHLQMVVSRLEYIYAELYKKLNDMRVEEEIKGEHFSVMLPVRTEPRPVWPDPVKILLGVLFGGMAAGFGLALMTHVFDNKVQSVSDVEAFIGVPFLGGVPFWVHTEHTGRVRPIVGDEHRSGAAEAYRALRTNVLAALEKTGRKVVLLTSADSKEGKTLTTLNLAIMVAKAGKRVLLMDMDLRRGVLHKSMEVERSPGIVDCLQQNKPIIDVVKPTTIENLWFAPAGSVENNTSELLQMTDLASVLSAIAEHYDYIFMDSAPVLRVTDTVVLARVPFCATIFVAHSDRTPKPMIRYSLEMLGDVRALGVIINSIQMNRISSLYYSYQYPNYAYYSYAYQYGYDYYLYDERGRHRPHKHRTFKTMRHATKKWLAKTFLPIEE